MEETPQPLTNIEETPQPLPDKVELRFDRLPKDGCPSIFESLTNEQKKVIEDSIPPLQNIIHYNFWSNVQYNGKDQTPLLTILTGNRITIFQERRFKNKPRTLADEQNEKQDYNFKIKLLVSLDLNEIKTIAYDKEKDVLLNAKKRINNELKTYNIQYKSDPNEYNLNFARCVYRNYWINYSVMKGDNDFVEALAPSPDIFPDLVISLSPSQCFQFLYYAKCVSGNSEYNQQVVQYIHSLVLLGMPIVDLSKLPLNLKEADTTVLSPIFEALSVQHFICGVCCSHTEKPDLMQSVKKMFSRSSKIRLIHFEDCGMTSGIKGLFEFINPSQNKEESPKKAHSHICYWNLRDNPFNEEDISYFIHILEITKRDKLFFLDLSRCNLSEDFMIKLYEELKRFRSLQHLYLAESPSNDNIINAFDQLLTSYEERGRIRLQGLDLSHVEKVKGYLEVLNRHKVPLADLKLAHIENFNDPATVNLLVSLIENSKTLRSLDLSQSTIPANGLNDIISSINDNEKLSSFNLYINDMGLDKKKWARVFAAFLSSNLQKWNTLSLNSNELDISDLKNFNTLFGNMELTSLSLNYNFVGSSEIDQFLVDTLEQSKNLRKLSICGDASHQLGNQNFPEKFIDKIGKSKITELDLSGNNFGPKFYEKLKEIIKERKDEPKEDYISRISIDGNGLQSINDLVDLTTEISKKPVIFFPFPEKDCMSLLNNVSDSEKRKMQISISQAKVSLVNAVNFNRCKLQMIPDLPFKATNEIRLLIKRLTKGMLKLFKKQNPLTHSLFCEEIGLPLPFQKIDDDAQKGGQKINNNIEQMKCYKSDVIGWSVKEEPKYSFIEKMPEKLKFDFDDNDDELQQEEESENDKIQVRSIESHNGFSDDDNEDKNSKIVKIEEEEADNEGSNKEDDEDEEERKKKERKKEKERRRKEREEERERRRREEEEEELERRRKEEEEEELERRRREEEEELERRRREEEEEELERERRRSEKKKRREERNRKRMQEENEEMERSRRNKEEKRRRLRALYEQENDEDDKKGADKDDEAVDNLFLNSTYNFGKRNSAFSASQKDKKKPKGYLESFAKTQRLKKGGGS